MIDIEDEITEIFSIGMNCHLKSKYDHNRTKIEIEKRNNSIRKLEKEKKISLENEERYLCKLKSSD